MREPSLASGDLDLVNGLTMLIGTGIGVGLTQYPNPDKSEAETKAWRNVRHRIAVQEAGRAAADRGSGIRALYKMRQNQIDQGKDTAKTDAAIAKYLAKNTPIDPKSGQGARETGRRGQVRFCHKRVRRPDQVKQLVKVATPDEKAGA
jgi:hypothetical protein